ncbi:MAG: class II SORL domain-containing protein [Candidatus Altiarchaeota archaeon]
MTDDKCDGDLFCGVNKANSSRVEDMSDLEKKHTPVIDVKKEGDALTVTVKVGKLLKHPNEHGHFIQWIELYSGETFLGRVDFASERTEPSAAFTVRLNHNHPLRAIGHCNMHGTWESEKGV